MMNIQNLGSKESTGVKFKESIWAELHLKLWFESERSEIWSEKLIQTLFKLIHAVGATSK